MSLLMNMMCCFLIWHACAFLIGQPQCFSKKTFISENIAEVRRERPVRVKTLDLFLCTTSLVRTQSVWLVVNELRKKERDKRGDLLSDSLASPPDLDQHQTLCISHTRPLHMYEHTDARTHALLHRDFSFHKTLWCWNKWTCMEKKNINAFLSIIQKCLYSGTLLVASLEGNSTHERICYHQLLNPHSRENRLQNTQHIYTQGVETLQHHYKAL